MGCGHGSEFSVIRSVCRVAAGTLLVLGLGAARVAAQDVGFEGPAYTGAGATPTESKPQNKLWFNDGFWWGSLWSTSASSFRIHRLNFTTHAWTDTGVAIEGRTDSHSDALWDGTKLYIASHLFTTGAGTSGNPQRLFRYSYNTSTDTYSLDAGFPVTIGDFSTESLTLAKDSTGTIWAAWTQGSRVRISHTTSSDLLWSASVILPTNTTNLLADDLCGIVSYGGNRVGVLWSDQVVNAYRFSFHVDGAADTAWSTVENATTGETDDHLNLAVHSDGRVFVAGKNAANNLLLLVRATNGTWSRFVITQPSPILTRPIVLLNEAGNLIHVFATGQDSGEVFEKTSPISSISFAAGTGTIRMRDSSTVFRISNPTSTSQNIDSSTGLVVLAHHDTTGFYWHHEVAPVVGAPVANFSGTPTSGAAPLNVTFTDASTGSITSRSWSFGDGGTSTATSPSHSYAAAGSYTVSLTVTGPGGSDTETKTDYIVVSSSAPVANFSGSPTSGTAPLNVSFTDASTGSITSRSWSFGDGGTSTATSPSHSYAAAGSYTVSLTVTGPGGSDTETKTNYIVVSPPGAPVASFGASPTSGPAPLAVTFTDTSTGGVNSWSWNFGDGGTSTAQNPVHTYIVEGTFTVSLTVTGPGGSDSVTMVDLIGVSAPLPIQTLLPIADARVNEASPSQNAGTATDLRVRFAAGGSYHTYLRFDLSSVLQPIVSAKLRLFCTDDSPVGGLVFPTTNGWTETGITWANKPAASGAQIGSVGAATLNTWMEVDLTGAVTGGGLVNLVLTSTSSNSCLYSSREGANPPELVIETGDSAPPVAAFSATPLTGPAPLLVAFTDESTGGPTSWSWSFGDGGTSSAQSPSHSYAAAGTYTVSLTATNSDGSDTETKTGFIVVTTPAPVANFSASPTSGVAPLNVGFTDASTGSITSRSWSFGDGGTSTATSPSHSYANPGTYTVSLTVTGPGGSDTETKTNLITVTAPAPVANFSASPTSGTAPLNVSFTDASTGSITSRSWSFGDGGTSSATSPSHSYASAGTYTVSLTVTGPGGSDTETKTDLIVVSAAPTAPVANFSASPTSGVVPLNVSFTDASTGSITSRSWSFGDGGTSTATSPSHNYVSPGTYTVSLTVTGPGGSDTETKTDLIVVSQVPAPVAGFGASPTSGTAPLDVSFTDASTGSITSRSWSFGDGGTSTATSPSHNYVSPGTYTVSLTVTGPGGSDTETKTDLIVVSSPPAPVADFTALPTSGSAPLNVAFTDTSTGPVTSWLWSFGDGGTSTAQHPMHSFAEGTFTVTLTVTGPGGTDDITKLDLIQVSAAPPIQTLVPVADARVSEGSPSTNAGTATELRVRLAAGGSYHTYLRFDLTGVSNVTSAKLRLFCTDESSVGGFVFPTSSAWNETGITWANKPAATGGQIGNLGVAAAAQWVEVDLGGAVSGGGLISFLLTSTSSNSALYSSREGVNQPQLVIETGSTSAPVAEFSASPLTGTAPLAVSFTDESTGTPTSWSWDFGDGASSSEQNPTHVYTTDGLFSVTLEATNAGGPSTITKTDLVSVAPPLGFQTFLPVADTRAGEPAPTTNFGTKTDLRLRGTAGISVQSFLRFDLTGVSATSATLRLFCTDASDVGGLVFPTSDIWTETGLTWNDKPAATGAQIASAGPVVAGTWVEFDVSAAVSGGGPVNFVLTSTSTDFAVYSSREGTNPPELVIETGAAVQPVAQFSASPLAGTAPLSVVFTDESTGGPTSWSWDFGDGASSNERNPTHVYTTSGLFTVTLEVFNAAGSGLLTKTDLIDVDPQLPIQTFLPVADARVSEANAGLNYGTSTDLRVRSAVGSSVHTYLRFDLTGLSGTITSAKLRLFCEDPSAVGGLFFQTASTWSETGITWTNKPAATSGQIASLGSVTAAAWVEIDVTTSVTGPGLTSFLMTSTSSDSALYASRENAHPPELVVSTTGP
jgi:PKD repeat protein